jgi:hypothetical protein
MYHRREVIVAYVSISKVYLYLKEEMARKTRASQLS